MARRTLANPAVDVLTIRSDYLKVFQLPLPGIPHQREDRLPRHHRGGYEIEDCGILVGTG